MLSESRPDWGVAGCSVSVSSGTEVATAALPVSELRQLFFFRLVFFLPDSASFLHTTATKPVAKVLHCTMYLMQLALHSTVPSDTWVVAHKHNRASLPVLTCLAMLKCKERPLMQVKCRRRYKQVMLSAVCKAHDILTTVQRHMHAADACKQGCSSGVTFPHVRPDTATDDRRRGQLRSAQEPHQAERPAHLLRMAYIVNDAWRRH